MSESPPTPVRPEPPGRWQEVLLLFLRIGATAFGGPAAHLAVLREEVVRRRRWLDDQRFLDLLGATNLIPGPNSTEMAIHIGYVRAGLAGMLAGGLGFILPSTLIVLGLSWAYVRYGTLPAAEGLLYGVKPVVVALIVSALISLGRRAVRGPLTGAVGAAAFGLYLLGLNEIGLLLAGGLAVVLAHAARRGLAGGGAAALALTPLMGAGPALAAPAGYSLLRLFLICLKIGSVLYGSGYVLLAFFRADLVTRLGWLSDAQLLDAIAVGQITPGPLFTSATFIGYLLDGVPGALAGTLGLSLPSFVFVMLTSPWIPRLRRSPRLGALLDGVNVASLGLMAGVTLQLGRASLIDALTVALALLAGLALWRTRLNTTWLIAGGAAVGALARVLGG